ncbi:MAG: AbrB/MazE/SpoVT family DNA-binding domain-containing protein [Kiritimatiellae bacterium]|mgnify:FL=1|jgi:antitoxin MazE|nr:AbrB/MazE/SpoVT family DNA-binding domain-containing protein [Kiritimatiellia bacterium]MDD4440772.1 AbrB/MazE/SpoVT family DNA-binding domain-containing protein [Kiritimatiellia bacterium]HQL49797.1 AbrB/MazE/SpoVT family DNA-binding domain-containing protein [Kiritimatiellia bacterium]
MITKVTKWGNSLAVRIPLAVAKETQLCVGETVNLSSCDGQIVIAPVRQQRYQLAELLKGITPRNLHDEVSSGAVVGKEGW